MVLLVCGVALFVFLASRAVLWARREHCVSEFAGSIVLGCAINPAVALIDESQRVKRSDERSGDPELLKS
jgi:hypothetical protein